MLPIRIREEPHPDYAERPSEHAPVGEGREPQPGQDHQEPRDAERPLLRCHPATPSDDMISHQTCPIQ